MIIYQITGQSFPHEDPSTNMEKWSKSCSVMSNSLRPHGLYSPWNSLGQNTGVGSLSLLQGIFPTQGSNPGLLHCRQIFYQLSHKGSPKILEWVAYPFSRGSSQPRNQTRVSCIAGRFFTSWATREAQEYWSGYPIPSPADLPEPGIEPGKFFTNWAIRETLSTLVLLAFWTR